VFNGQYDFSSRMSFLETTESFSHVAQRVTSIYDRRHSSGCKKVFQNTQILLVDISYEETCLLAPDQ